MPSFLSILCLQSKPAFNRTMQSLRTYNEINHSLMSIRPDKINTGYDGDSCHTRQKARQDIAQEIDDCLSLLGSLTEDNQESESVSSYLSSILDSSRRENSATDLVSHAWTPAACSR